MQTGILIIEVTEVIYLKEEKKYKQEKTGAIKDLKGQYLLTDSYTIKHLQ